MTDAPLFDRHMLEALVCPVTHAPLDYDAARQELVSLRQRAAPFIELLERSGAAGKDVVWGV